MKAIPIPKSRVAAPSRQDLLRHAGRRADQPQPERRPQPSHPHLAVRPLRSLVAPGQRRARDCR